MEPMKKRAAGDTLTFVLLLLWPILFIIVLLVGIWTKGAVQKPIVRHRVLEYAPIMEEMGQQALDLAAVGEVLPSWTEDKTVRIDADGGLVFWETYSYGLVPSGREYGYYYAADGKPHPHPLIDGIANEVPVMFGSRWQQRDGDDGSYSEHITGNMYYYELWW